MQARKRVTLRSIRDADGSRHLDAHVTAEGDVVVEGQDLGPGVERAFGPGLTEYEWTHTVRAADVPLLVEALGGAPGDDVLALMRRVCSGDGVVRLAALLAPDGPVPAEFWSRVGD
ncbi:MAG: hypothetical protein H0W01_13450 [Pseudonocardiales bacterium]|nr:hypothetical protein [Pseudonocardiales bacterium]